MRSSKVNEFSIGDAFSKVIKGLRQEINGIIGEIDRSKNLTLEEMKGLLKNSLEAMVCSVETVMTGVSDQLAVERKRKEVEERNREERIRGIEEKGGKERKKKELEKRYYDGKMEILEEMEQKEQDREEKIRSLKERMENMEREVKKERMEVERIVGKMEIRLLQVEKGEKERERMETDIREHKVRIEEKERKEAEKALLSQKVEKAMESEKEMEKKVCSAMAQIKILDLDFGKLLERKDVMEKAAIDLIQENVKLSDRQEWKWNIRRSRVFILGKATREKGFEGRKIFTVPILISCPCTGDKESLERIIRNAGIRVSFHWPTEMLEYVKGIRDRVEGMGHGGREEFVRVRAVKEEGELFLRADVRRKEGGKFRWIGDWKCPPLDREKWAVADDILKPYCRSADVGNRN